MQQETKEDERIIAVKTPKMTYFHRPSIAVSLLIFSQILPPIIANPMAVVVAPSATTAALQQQQAAAAAAAAVSSTDKRQAGRHRHSETNFHSMLFTFDLHKPKTKIPVPRGHLLFSYLIR